MSARLYVLDEERAARAARVSPAPPAAAPPGTCGTCGTLPDGVTTAAVRAIWDDGFAHGARQAADSKRDQS